MQVALLGLMAGRRGAGGGVTLRIYGYIINYMPACVRLRSLSFCVFDSSAIHARRRLNWF
jgi:hypothetical protein